MRTGVQACTPGRRSATFVRLSQLRKLRECEQVAAVCYRMRRERVEFLLVRTRGSGRWTFPKGNTEPGMTHAHAAALEAFEEAGVHGRIEEVSFAQYLGRKRVISSESRSVEQKLLVNAHLCEVQRLGAPKEANRKRTWFPFETAKEGLQEGRKRDEAAALAGVLKQAMERIKIQQATSAALGNRERNTLERQTQRDPLNQILFERAAEKVVVRRLPHGEIHNAPMRLTQGSPGKLVECEVLPFSTSQDIKKRAEWFAGKKKPKALGVGARN
jgi:8-oxo-dGTP pyrophosphatase MutT (NUDIX family)